MVGCERADIARQNVERRRPLNTFYHTETKVFYLNTCGIVIATRKHDAGCVGQRGSLKHQAIQIYGIFVEQRSRGFVSPDASRGCEITGTANRGN